MPSWSCPSPSLGLAYQEIWDLHHPSVCLSWPTLADFLANEIRFRAARSTWMFGGSFAVPILSSLWISGKLQEYCSSAQVWIADGTRHSCGQALLWKRMSRESCAHLRLIWGSVFCCPIAMLDCDNNYRNILLQLVQLSLVREITFAQEPPDSRGTSTIKRPTDQVMSEEGRLRRVRQIGLSCKTALWFLSL